MTDGPDTRLRRAESPYEPPCGLPREDLTREQEAAVTLKKRIRYLTDGLRPGAYLSVAELLQRLPNSTLDTVGVYVGEMFRADQLRRKRIGRVYAYRSGPRPVEEKTPGRPKSQRLGFMALARLEREDPEAYGRAIAAERA